MGVPEIEAFLTHLAVQEHVAASTQNQALSALLFLYREVLCLPLDERIDAVRAKPSRKLPTVLTKDEVRSVIVNMTGVHRLLVQMLYGSGLRLREAIQLRVKDLDFPQYQIVVRDAKGHDSRVTLRHSHGAGVVGAQGCETHDDLHPCVEPGWARGEKSAGLS
jgi:site-specific recombinase XerD